MSNIQSLANQLAWSGTTKDYLNSLNGEIRYVSGQYQSTVDDLSGGNYMNELLMQIQQMEREFKESADDLIKHIESEHLSYIDKQSQSIQGALEEVMRGS